MSSAPVKYPLVDYIPLFLLVCLSGNPLFTTGKFQKPFLMLFAAGFIVYSLYYITAKALNKGVRLLLITILFIVLLSTFQLYTLGYVSYPGVFALVLKVIMGLFFLVYYQSIGINPYLMYVNLFSFLAKASLPLFALNFFTFSGLPLDVPYTKSLLLYTSFDLPKDMLRNSGMFWEPGAFAGYLVLALLFIILQNRGFTLGAYKKQAIWIVLGLLTTLSTTGFLVLALILLIYIVQNYKFGKFILIPVIAVGGYFAYNNLEILGEKLEDQYNEAAEMDKSDVSNTRFGALNMDLQYIEDKPFTGNGLDKRTRYRFHPWVDDGIGHGNGMSNFIVYWGIPFFLFWLICVFRFAYISTASVSTAVWFTVIMILILQGEQFLNYPLFLLFFTAPAIEFLWNDDEEENDVEEPDTNKTPVAILNQPLH